ncbi:hypothetical protein [Dorea formicigenerans]|uniref:hypothetical protein n=1 Tax=Dorea formicigenerans TaxID=39486 RepID=UPI000E541524|nr:hypothetical protein [Dorea formicigenerans]RGT36644.1 hypothetical protein DWX30_15065 [Dorea formicigenerans]RHC48367.1 hypothetical protein DW838_09065 [Dorea formicigenerans]
MMDSLLLYKILKNRTGAEISASGNPAIMSDTLKNNPMNEMKVFGWSKQETTKGKNLFDFSRLVSDGVNAIDYEKQTITVPAKTNNTGYNQTLRDLCPGITPGTYVLSMKRSNPESNRGSYFLEAAKDFLENTPTELTDALLDNHIAWYNNPDSEVENVISEIQIEIGTEATDYEPYTGGQPSPSPDYPQEIVSAGSDGKIGVEVRGKNLFELTGIRDNEYLRIEKIENNTIYARPTNMNAESPGTTNYSNGWVNFSEKIKVISGILYTISLSYKAVQKMMEIEKLDPARILVFKDSENIILNEEIKQEIGKYVDVEIPLLIPDGTDSIYFTITCNNCSVAIKNIQIEEGGYTSYEPYHEPQSLSISTPTGLLAIPVDSDGNYTDANGQQWISDYVDLKRGKYVQNICDLPLKDISLEWYTWGTNANVSNGTGFFAYVTKYARVGNTKALATICRHHIDAWGGRRVGCNADINNSYITISLHTSDLDDASDNTKAIASFKKIVEQTDAHVLYVRAEPIETDLTTEEIQAYKNLVTYAGTTIVENDAECYMEVSAGGGDALRTKKLALLLGD